MISTDLSNAIKNRERILFHKHFKECLYLSKYSQIQPCSQNNNNLFIKEQEVIKFIQKHGYINKTAETLLECSFIKAC